MFLEQFCSIFFSQVLVEYFEPKLLNERHIDNVAGLRTTYQIYLEILKGITNEAMALTMFYFIFGRRVRALREEEDERSMLQGVQDEEATDFDLLKEPNTKLDDRAKDQKDKPAKLAKEKDSQDAPDLEEGESPGIGNRAPSAQMKDMSLQFSKLNFQAKNKLSSHAIEFPFSQKDNRHEELAFIE